GPQSLLILCGTYRPRTRVNHFARLVRQSRLPILDLSDPPDEEISPTRESDQPPQGIPLQIPPAAPPGHPSVLPLFSKPLRAFLF
ncbi:MAG: hypothetical protein K2L46_09305, partial [Paramuribaculum sp.]|nr:hypothetical protein [Paramuribaculum sp.]